MKTKNILIFLSFLQLFAKLTIGEYAVVIDPVVDGYGAPSVFKEEDIASPLLGDCQRLHQLLFNEVVKIKDLKKFHAQVECGSFFYSSIHGEEQNSLWINKKKIIAIKDLSKKALKAIPISLNISKFIIPNNLLNKLESNSLILKKPFKQYSTGTRFAIKKEIENFYKVELIGKNNILRTINIPKKYFQEKLLDSEKRENFVKIIEYLANQKIPITYVWGGTSFIKEKNKNKNKLPLIGLDCSGLILRVAQIVGIPYFYKNSLTASAYLEQITNYKDIQKGDIIWVTGHVIIITDPINNLCAEANGYYKCLHQLKIDQIFEGIHSFKKLLEQGQLLRIRPDNKNKLIKDFKILKLPI